ncbi:MAG: winged helix-turn-helix transcriptional regulator, partial [Lentisphaeria bacterium]|nr:winged helix-turn-helix transcriptional regulator [Lentisphaeria bacterium]
MGLKSSPIKRRQIINEIMESIRTGKLVGGERLAPVRDLAKHFNVSLSVVQNAMRELIGNGFVECRGHSGFYV